MSDQKDKRTVEVEFDFLPDCKLQSPKGRIGAVFTGPCPAVMAGLSRNTHVTGIVRMYGKRYRILGIERFLTGTPYREGESIGIRLDITEENIPGEGE